MLNNKLFILFFMIFMHIVDDYYLQGILAQMKQKAWWDKNAPNTLYKNDYKAALICHAFSWSFMIMLPLAIYNFKTAYILLIILNTITHASIDNEKANRLTINLIQDQLVHLVQIVASWAYYMYIFI